MVASCRLARDYSASASRAGKAERVVAADAGTTSRLFSVALGPARLHSAFGTHFMKPAYIWIVVFFRVLAVCVALFGLFSVGSGLVLASSAGSGLTVPMMFIRLLLVYLAWAVVLWLLSRPIARLILRDLDRE